MADPDVMGNNNIFLHNNIIEPPLLKYQIASQPNHILVAVIALSILCYI